MPWIEIIGTLLVQVARIAIEFGGEDGKGLARGVKDLLSDSDFPALRRVAREIGDEAKARLPRRSSPR